MFKSEKDGRKHNFLGSASVVAIALAGGLMMSAPATAGGMVQTYKPAAATTNWGGLYVGTHIGAGQADFDGVFKSSDSAVFFDQLDNSGALGGIHIGHNWDFGQWVAGIEGDFSFTDWEANQKAGASSEEGIAVVDMLASIRGRLGITTGDQRQALLYATAGVAIPDVDVTVYTNPRPAGAQNISFDDVGGVFGGGLEWAITRELRLRGETLYYWFDDRASITHSDANPGDNVELESAWTTRVGLSWLFGGGTRR